MRKILLNLVMVKTSKETVWSESQISLGINNEHLILRRLVKAVSTINSKDKNFGGRDSLRSLVEKEIKPRV